MIDSPQDGTPLVLLLTLTKWYGAGKGRCEQCRRFSQQRAIVERLLPPRDLFGKREILGEPFSATDQAYLDRWMHHYMHEQLAGRFNHSPVRKLCWNCARGHLDEIQQNASGSLSGVVGHLQPKLQSALFSCTRSGVGEKMGTFILNDNSGNLTLQKLVQSALRAFITNPPPGS